jgi:thymidylate synthase (FAD)
VPIEEFHRRWYEGTHHPIAKKKPGFLERIDLAREYTIPELARLVERREETLRNCVRDGSLSARRVVVTSPHSPAIRVSGAAWKEFVDRQCTATVPMRSRLAQMQLRSCNENTGEIEHTNVVDVWESGIKPVYRVTLENGRTLVMSKDHKCLTDRGWLTLEAATQLHHSRSGNVVWSSHAPALAVNGIPAYQDQGWLRAKRSEGLDLREIAAQAGISVHSIRKYLKRFGLQYSAKERSALSGRAQRGQRRNVERRPWSAERLANVRKARSGPNSNFWKGGVSSDRENIGRWTTQVARQVHERFNFQCVLCRSNKRLHAHHLDPVWHNLLKARDIDNLVSLCGKCHDQVHALNIELELLEAFNAGLLDGFWTGRSYQPRPIEKTKPPVRRLVRSYSKVASIEYAGEQMTYDLEVAGPFHNFVANGFIVHNSVNEYSGRYSLMPMLFHTPTADQLQKQSKQNNQGRSGEAVPEAQYKEAVERWTAIRAQSQSAYEWMTGNEIARELARIDLPLSTYTQWYWKIDLHNFLHFLKLRVDSHAQWEIQEYGRVMAGMLKKLAPHSYEAWVDYDVCGSRMSRMELDVLRKLVSANADGVSANAGQTLDRAALEAAGLSRREVDELVTKLSAAPVPDFELDVSKAVPAEVFAERMAKAVPKVDKPPSE